MAREAESASVAIVGGGAAGLACAQQLLDHGFNVSLFNTGKRGMGGLLATRRFSCKVAELDATLSPLLFDTAAQLFSASHPRFRSLCEHWERLGWIRRWTGRAIQILADGSTKDLGQPNGACVYAAIGGMEQLATHVAEELRMKGTNMRAQMWASNVERTPDGRWDIKWDLWSMKVSDYLVIAHSGKCAKRLTSARGLERCHAVVSRVQLGVVWCVAVAFAEPLRVPFEVAAVEGCLEIAWASNQTAKLGTVAEVAECWVLLSTNTYGWRHKVPQEFVPVEMTQAVSADLLQAFEKLIAPMREGESLPAVLDQHVQLWGAALPGVVLDNADAVFDPVMRAGVCADWCVAPCIEGAVLSGLQLADLIRAHRLRKHGAAYTMQPEGEARFMKYKPVCQIAAFPGWLDPSVVAHVAEISPHQTITDSSPPIVPVSQASRRSRWNREGPVSNFEATKESTEAVGLLTSIVVGGTDASSHPEHLPIGHMKSETPCNASHAQMNDAAQTSGKIKRWRSKQETLAFVSSGLNGVNDTNQCRGRKPEENELLSLPYREVMLDAECSELCPGLVLLRGVLSLDAQQWLADEASELGGLSKKSTVDFSRSDGFFRASRGGQRELNVQPEARGSFVLRLSECDGLLKKICLQCFTVASMISSNLPGIDAEACAFNYYAENSSGMRWHRDIDEIGDSIRSGIGRPVVSLSLGDSCDFDYCPVPAEDVTRRIHLCSGDAVIFGGPSRGFMHAVTRIYPGKRPSALRMEPGRLNLTFRHHA